MSSTEPIHSYRYRLCSQHACSIVISITSIVNYSFQFQPFQLAIITVTLLNAGLSIIALQSYFQDPNPLTDCLHPGSQVPAYLAHPLRNQWNAPAMPSQGCWQWSVPWWREGGGKKKNNVMLTNSSRFITGWVKSLRVILYIGYCTFHQYAKMWHVTRTPFPLCDTGSKWLCLLYMPQAAVTGSKLSVLQLGVWEHATTLQHWFKINHDPLRTWATGLAGHR